MKKQGTDRMNELTKMFAQKGEIFIKPEEKELNEELIKIENKRLLNLGTKDANHIFREDYNSTPTGGGMNGNKMFAKTVNTITNDQLGNVAISYKPIRQPLRSSEALEIAVKRTIASGAVSGSDFYDEVNQNMMSMGFPATDVLAIKNCIGNLNMPPRNKVD